MANIANTVWLDEEGTCSLDTLSELSGLSLSEVQELVDYGVLAPEGAAAGQSGFRLRYVKTVRMARRLRDDFELDNRALALALSLLHRIEQLETELSALDARFPRRSP